ncbi:hypothetical protein [Nostoc sp. MG11]|uniref:hypothetical protein n=1 Tax=Nostoc sp. MG11 TaxID=2721166 RepID=UPI001868B67A|nr:hypothetical protein [Nostoc sp. MG11]
MTERGEIYNHNGKATAASFESRDLAERFAKAIGEFNWRTDYVKFCDGGLPRKKIRQPYYDMHVVPSINQLD